MFTSPRTFFIRSAAALAAVFAVGAQAGDITPESLALMAAPWRPAAQPVAKAALPAKAAPKAELTAAADEPYDYDPPPGGWHVPGTPVTPPKVTVAGKAR